MAGKYEVFLRKYIRSALATSVHYLPIAKNSRENFHGKLKNCENRERLAQRIFPRSRYWYPQLEFDELRKPLCMYYHGICMVHGIFCIILTEQKVEPFKIVN